MLHLPLLHGGRVEEVAPARGPRALPPTCGIMGLVDESPGTFSSSLSLVPPWHAAGFTLTSSTTYSSHSGPWSLVIRLPQAGCWLGEEEEERSFFSHGNCGL